MPSLTVSLESGKTVHVKLVKAGYITQEFDYTVPSTAATVTKTMIIEKGTLNITTNPTGATVKVGTETKTSPCNFTLAPGTYTVTVSMAGYDTITDTEVAITSGETTTKSYTLTITDPCTGVSCPNKCVGYTYYYGGYCSEGNCIYKTKGNALECGYVPPDPCAGVSCPDKCVGTTLYYNGYCSEGKCIYTTKINAIECGYIAPPPQMDKATFISKITGKIDLSKIPQNATSTYRWFHAGYASNFIVWGKTGDDKAISIAFTWCGAKNANPPTYVECIGFREFVPPGKITDATIEEEIANAALAALPYLVTVTFTAKNEAGAELTGVGVSIDGEKKGTT